MDRERRLVAMEGRHDLEVGVERGYFTREQATAFREEGERVIAEWPFPTGWEQ